MSAKRRDGPRPALRAVLLLLPLCLCACGESGRAMRERLDQTADVLNQALIRAKTEVAQLRKKAAQRLADADQGKTPARPDPATHRFFGRQGVYYKCRDDGGCGMWASGFTPVDERVLRTIAAIESLSPDIVSLVTADELFAQGYILANDDFGVFYPYLDSVAFFPPLIDFHETYAPFYEAAPERNPGRGEVWLRPYLDATGKGYMTSVSSPIFLRDGSFAGVAGGDVEAITLKTRFLDPERNQMLLTRGFIPLAATDACVELLGLHDFTKFRYLEGVDKDAYASREYGLEENPELRDLAGRLGPGVFFEWEFHGRTFQVYGAPVAETGWLLAELAER